jgi:hypothetical protein
MLRPLSLGEILDRSFAVYRANFWLFAGIAVLSATVELVAQMIVLVITRGSLPQANLRAPFHFHVVGRQVGSWIALLLFFLTAAVTQAATVWALSEVYLGRRTTIKTSIEAVIGRWLRFVGVAAWQGWSMIWLPMLLLIPAFFLMASSSRFGVFGMVGGGVLTFLAATGGMVFGIIAFIRNSLAIPAAVLEDLKVRAAMRRSKVLAAGAKGRIFVVFLIAWCLLIVAGMLEMPLALIVGLGAMKGERHVMLQAVMLLVNFVARSVVMPVLMIGLALVYFDQRVRQDGLDLLLMLGGGLLPEAKGSAPATTAEPASDAAGF